MFGTLAATVANYAPYVKRARPLRWNDFFADDGHRPAAQGRYRSAMEIQSEFAIAHAIINRRVKEPQPNA